METDELIAKLHELLDESEDRHRPIRATATINRGMCADSVTYDSKPVYTRREAELVRIVREAYAARGLRIDMETDKGVSTFFRVFMEACRDVCSDNGCVNILGLLTFKAQVYAHVDDRAQLVSPLEAGTYTLAVFTRSGLGGEYGVRKATRKVKVA